MCDKKRISVLVTAGGTKEEIDSVRSVTNHSSGRLGSLIADQFIKSGADVTYLRGEGAELPKLHAKHIITVKDVYRLIEVITELLHNNEFDFVIHSMAVSDFTPQTITTVDALTDTIVTGLRSAKQMDLTEVVKTALLSGAVSAEAKISSSSQPVLVLKKTPKVIGLIKSIQPKTILVGFKLLYGVEEEALVEAGLGLIKNHGCDFVVANDLKYISRDNHKAVLLDSGGILCHAETKPAIARIIFDVVTDYRQNI